MVSGHGVRCKLTKPDSINYIFENLKRYDDGVIANIHIFTCKYMRTCMYVLQYLRNNRHIPNPLLGLHELTFNKFMYHCL